MNFNEGVLVRNTEGRVKFVLIVLYEITPESEAEECEEISLKMQSLGS
jgi:hypothetical protein